jgi:hypothetical protein
MEGHGEEYPHMSLSVALEKREPPMRYQLFPHFIAMAG